MRENDILLFQEYTNQKNSILNYENVVEIISKLALETSKKYKLIDGTTEKTKFGYPLYYYQVGTGKKQVVLIAGTHGSEIITVDVLLRFWHSLLHVEQAEHLGQTYTFHIIPLLNPEGFILSNAAIETVLDNQTSMEDMEKLAKDFYYRFRNDDIFSKQNPKDVSVKEHQKFMKSDNLNREKHTELLKHALELIEKQNVPMGSLISWRANGSGVDLNDNTEHVKPKDRINNRIVYGGLRYNNLSRKTPGPLGVRSIDSEQFVLEKENQFLLQVLDKIERISVILTYHATGGIIFHKPYMNVADIKIGREQLMQKKDRNLELAKIYAMYVNYPVSRKMPYGDFDDYLRLRYPGVLLLELSKMGGNPLGPYGDLSNYQRVIDDNLKAVFSLIEKL